VHEIGVQEVQPCPLSHGSSSCTHDEEIPGWFDYPFITSSPEIAFAPLQPRALAKKLRKFKEGMNPPF
jgi:hypothetical protein